MTGGCRACGSPDLAVVLSLGPMPLANALRRADQLHTAEPRYPLDLAFCPDCTLVQLAHTVSPAVLFGDYPYLSSYSDTMLRHAEALASSLVERHRLDASSLIVELGSNDGYLLQYFRRSGLRVLGVDPATAACRAAEAVGVPTRCAFFGQAFADALVNDEGLRADVVLANNVMAHVPDLHDVLSGIRTVLAPDGVFVMETPHVRMLLQRNEFDTIYHEHVFYYSLTALTAVLARHGLTVVDVAAIPIHGGSLRVTASMASTQVSPAVPACLDEEARWGVRELDTYQAFAARITALRTELREFLIGRKRRGCRLAAYGAAAKGATLLNAIGVGRDVLDFVVDRNPTKQGRYLPGTDLPIRAPEQLLAERPDEVLLLTWNLADEILAQEEEYRRRGGRFIIPIPFPRTV
jgi:SAM-dependent methyltransferase